ncbi:hypothetical protein [Polaribacter cellanae]|uniref:Uncharacterized protein n=1 Tax=Polaribacter cellanae TaxID=2818493 RepID=A0A975CK68_9FLAO|nr:hypothetical protein [Polaribacter cellanae]QTE21188.1 hypothetical protein J3359_10065 [Polaribacter cellanae]
MLQVLLASNAFVVLEATTPILFSSGTVGLISTVLHHHTHNSETKPTAATNLKCVAPAGATIKLSRG